MATKIIGYNPGSFTADPIGSPLSPIVYDSYSGTDIVAEMILPGETPLTLGELQTISYSSHRENSPVRIVGHTSPVGFVRGPRTIAGSMIFTQFHTYSFYRLNLFRDAVLRKGLYPIADMLPPFDVVITFANEYGVFSAMKIYGITIVDEGGVMSVENLVTEATYTYMARSIQPIRRIVPNDITGATESLYGQAPINKTLILP